MDGHQIELSPQRSKERIEKALQVFDPKVLSKILAFALYMLGGKRNDAATIANMPEESLKTTIRLVLRDGFEAFQDRRRSKPSLVAKESQILSRIQLRQEKEWIVVEFDCNGGELRIPASHKVQLRTILLSFLNSGRLSVQQTASILGICEARCRELAKELESNDVKEALVDKRQGPPQDYRVGPTQKAEIIQQLAARAVTGHPMTSEVLAREVNEQTQSKLSPRTVRWHINKLGLSRIKTTLPKLVETLKKKLLRRTLKPTLERCSEMNTVKNDQNLSLCKPKSPSVSVAMQERIFRRQTILDLIKSGIMTRRVASFIDCSGKTVRRWIRRSNETNDLSDSARSGRRAIYPEQTHFKVVAFYCQTQPLPDCGRWTLRWAELHLKNNPSQIGASPSKSLIHRILNKNRLKPHQSRYFLHITDPDFFPKMENLVKLYKNPPANLFFFDECPGIQILKRIVPDLRTEEMKKRLEEFEYIRKGTIDLFAFLNHADGKIYAECHGDHKTSTFLGVFKRHVSRFKASDQLHYGMDNLASHCGYPFCQIVAELSALKCPSEKKLDTKTKRVEWLQSESKRIVIHFTPYHGSWLNLVEIWFGIIGRTLFRESFACAQAFLLAYEAFLEEWNSLLAHPFQWS